MSTKNLKPGRNATSFSKDHQPPTAGRKKIRDIRKLMNAFGNTPASLDLLNDVHVQHFLTVNGLTGTYNEVLIAKLYALAFKGSDIRAFELILKMSADAPEKGNSGITINFITPAAIDQEKTIELKNDSFSIVEPGEAASD